MLVFPSQKVGKGKRTRESGQKSQSNTSENIQQNKWSESGVDVCEQTVRIIQRSQSTASVTPKEKKSSSQWLKRSSHGLWMVGWKWDSEMNHQGDDAGALVWSNENIERWLAEGNQNISTISDDMGLMSGKGPGEMAAITSAGNAQVDTLLQSKEGLLMLSSFFRRMVHFATKQKAFQLFFRKDTSAQGHGQQFRFKVELKECSILQSWSGWNLADGEYYLISVNNSEEVQQSTG